MTEIKEKYACFKTSKVEDRCLKITREDYEGVTYPSLKECMKNCNLEEETAALDKLKANYRLKKIVEFIRPNLITTFDKMNDLPILNVDDKLYNRKLLNVDEIKMLYIILNLHKNKNIIHRNLFLEDLVKSLNGQIGLSMSITSIDSLSIKIDSDSPLIVDKSISHLLTDIIYDYDLKKKYVYHFLSDEYIDLFNKEIKSFYESDNIYLTKNVYIEKIDAVGHHTQILIKKNIHDGKIKLKVFIYDSISDGIINPISEKLEEFMNTHIKYDHSVFNLSKIYGIQNLEDSTFDDYSNHMQKLIDIHVTSIYNVINKLLKDLKSVYLDYKEKNKPFSPKAFTKFIIDTFLNKLFKTHFLINDIKIFIRKIIDIILSNEKKFLEDSKYTETFYYKYIDSLMMFFKSKSQNLSEEIDKINLKTKKIRQEIHNQYNFDFFEGNCYLWSYYTIILILINPTLEPYDIIKATYYQSSKTSRMNKLYKNMIENIQYNNREFLKSYFDIDYIKNQNIKFEKFKKKVENKKLDVELLEHTRLIYIKITNLILINILYNRIENKYLLNTIEKGCQQEYCFNEFIPQKVNEMLDKLSFDGTKLTKEFIIDIIKRGVKINDINSAILSDKSVVPYDKETLYFEPRVKISILKFKEKYLKYKNKYLQLKKLLNK